MKIIYVNNKNSSQFEADEINNDIFAKYYSPTCPACISMEQDWDDMCNDLEQNYDGDLTIAAFDPDAINNFYNIHKRIDGYPTMMILKNGKKHHEYQGNRTKNDMIQYLLDKKLISKKMKGGSKSLINTNNKKCSDGKFNLCCPHMPLDSKGRYAATTLSRPHILHLNGQKFRFFTCCQMCAKQMISLAKSNPKKFKSMYVEKIQNGKIYFKHKNTKKMVQIGVQINHSTRKNKKGGSLKFKNDLSINNLQNLKKEAIMTIENSLRENSLRPYSSKSSTTFNYQDKEGFSEQKNLFPFCLERGLKQNCDGRFDYFDQGLPAYKNLCRKSPGLYNFCIPSNRKFNPSTTSDNKEASKQAYLFLILLNLLYNKSVINFIQNMIDEDSLFPEDVTEVKRAQIEKSISKKESDNGWIRQSISNTNPGISEESLNEKVNGKIAKTIKKKFKDWENQEIGTVVEFIIYQIIDKIFKSTKQINNTSDIIDTIIETIQELVETNNSMTPQQVTEDCRKYHLTCPRSVKISQPSRPPTTQPSAQPTAQPSSRPSGQPTSQPSMQPTGQPTGQPSGQPTGQPSAQPSGEPTGQPTSQPTSQVKMENKPMPEYDILRNKLTSVLTELQSPPPPPPPANERSGASSSKRGVKNVEFKNEVDVQSVDPIDLDDKKYLQNSFEETGTWKTVVPSEYLYSKSPLKPSGKGGKKKTRKNKSCIGRRDGKKGCRTCCKTKKKYKKCIKKCMRGY
jgi:thiol-disulfide isomerase/thioredoxin